MLQSISSGDALLWIKIETVLNQINEKPNLFRRRGIRQALAGLQDTGSNITNRLVEVNSLDGGLAKGTWLHTREAAVIVEVLSRVLALFEQLQAELATNLHHRANHLIVRIATEADLSGPQFE